MKRHLGGVLKVNMWYLEKISIKNYGLIADQEMIFSRGLNVISGETGAGKSLIFRAVEMLLDHSDSRNKIRHGKDAAEVTLVFKEIAEKKNGVELLNEWSFTKIVPQKGKIRSIFNGENVAQKDFLDQLNPLLDFCYQHTQIKLLDPQFQINFMDKSCLVDRTQYEFHLHQIKRFMKSFETEFSKSQRDVEMELSFLENQFQELQKLNLLPDEFSILEKKMSLLQNQQKIKSLVFELSALFTEGDPPIGQTLTAMSKGIYRLQQFLQEDKNELGKLEVYSEKIENSLAHIDEFQNYLASLESSETSSGLLKNRWPLSNNWRTWSATCIGRE